MKIQVILYQKHSFLHQLTQNMTIDCSLNYESSKWKLQVVHYIWISKQKQFDVPNMYWTCIFLVLNLYFNKQSVVIFWVNWCKYECFWQRINCTELRGIDLQHFMEMKYYWPSGEQMELSGPGFFLFNIFSRSLKFSSHEKNWVKKRWLILQNFNPRMIKLNKTLI